jgi:nicotinamidase-related amidase
MSTPARNDPSSATVAHWATSALLTIDMQRDFSEPDAPGYVAGTEAIIPALCALTEAFRRAHRPVFHAVRLYLPDGSNAELCRRHAISAGRRLAQPGSQGARLIEALADSDGPDHSSALLAGEFIAAGAKEWLFFKPRWSAFFSTILEQRLRAYGIDTLIVAGCNFPNCPSATLFDATERDFRTVLAVDAVSRFSESALEWCAGLGVATPTVGEVQKSLASL